MSNLIEALHSTDPVSGMTHTFYKYPGRMSPAFARTIVQEFSSLGDIVLDPFMGGGTTIVEAVAHGRQAIGVDLNSIASFVAKVKTTPLSSNDRAPIVSFLKDLEFVNTGSKHTRDDLLDPRVTNIPEPFLTMFDRALAQVQSLRLPRQRQFVRCVLLKVGQWAIDCKDRTPDEIALRQKLQESCTEMLEGLDEFVQIANEHGIAKNKITGQRRLLYRSSVGLEQATELANLSRRPKLVLTSPPYPGVRMLYHRWQVGGRRATPAPYWIIDSSDGQFEPYYTMGGTSITGQQKYFSILRDVFTSIRRIIDPQAIVVQLISFANPEQQLTLYRNAMLEAGFTEFVPVNVDDGKLWRSVPRRKWYNRINGDRGAAKELVLFHRVSPP